MSGGDFFDSNVFVYLVDGSDASKHIKARALVDGALANASGVISFQVVQETLHVLTRKFKVIVNASDATALMQQTLQPMWRVQPSLALYAQALKVQEDRGFAFYDSLIVAAALEAGCSRLLTEDLQDGQRIGKLRIENPFRT